VRAGGFATLVTYGEMIHLAVEACDYIAAEYEKEIGVFDLRCLSPLDLTAIEADVALTRRLIVLHEGRLTHGFGAEIVARIVERPGAALAARPLRVGSLDLPVPFAHELETAYRPSKDKLIERITEWLA
jgi:2-oxoisovalerate dehydrogenase E1 component